MRYHIRHTTRFEYSQPIRESVMELRMQPRTDEVQRCLEFDLDIEPAAVAHRYTDYLQNAVHHFDVPSFHERLEVTASALVELHAAPIDSPRTASARWADLDALRDSA